MIDERSRLSGEAYEVAPMLLGWIISHRSDAGTVTVALTEVEAYAGESDPASHAYRGRSPRNSVMFGPAGFLYCYFTYGMHWCCNVVTGPDGKASAVLLRAGRVVEGVDLARTRRGERVSELSLARGPANLAQALGLGREQNGADLLSGGTVSLSPGSVSGQVSSGPRVGISVAHETPWRFWLTGEPSVSAYKRSPKAM
jgi:DNA-3-methyladenine glycosylase